MPPCPFCASYRRLRRKSYRLSSLLTPRAYTLPPSPPLPPSGPPLGMNFSRRKLRQPLPPLPAFTVMTASSTNLILVLSPRRAGASLPFRTSCDRRHPPVGAVSGPQVSRLRRGCGTIRPRLLRLRGFGSAQPGTRSFFGSMFNVKMLCRFEPSPSAMSRPVTSSPERPASGVCESRRTHAGRQRKREETLRLLPFQRPFREKLTRRLRQRRARCARAYAPCACARSFQT